MTDPIGMTLVEQAVAGWLVATGSVLIVLYHITRYVQRRRGY